MSESREKTFVRVCSIRELPSRRGSKVVFDDDLEVAIFQVEGRLYAVSNICPHQHAPVIADGFLEGCTVMCPLHGWTYDLATGRPIIGGAHLKTYEVYLDGDDVMLEKPEPEIPAWMR